MEAFFKIFKLILINLINLWKDQVSFLLNSIVYQFSKALIWLFSDYNNWFLNKGSIIQISSFSIEKEKQSDFPIAWD